MTACKNCVHIKYDAGKSALHLCSAERNQFERFNPLEGRTELINPKIYYCNPSGNCKFFEQKEEDLEKQGEAER